jgi:hypothetical protein
MEKLPVRNLIGSLLIAIASVVAQPALAALTLTVGVEIHNVPRKADSKIPGDARDSFNVTLADSYIAVKSPLQTTVFDFKARRRLVLNEASKSYIAYSLYDAVGFRSLELRNRDMLHGVLAAAKVDGIPMDTVDNEHILSLLSRSPAVIDEAADSSDLVFYSGKRELARWSKTGFEVKGDDAERFAKFIRYNQGGHPRILSKLAKGNVIPHRMILTFTEVWGTSYRSLSITALHQVSLVAIDLNGYKEHTTATSPDELDRILDEAAGLRPDAMTEAAARNQNDVQRALRDGQLLDAMLGLIEWSLMTGQGLPNIPADQMTKVRSDPSVQKLTAIVGAKTTKEDFAAAVKALVELRPQAPNKSYVLKIFEANDRIRLGDSASSKMLFVDVLQHNLFVAGVYKDLGDLLLMQYDSPRAWRCWDIGRRLAPQFPNFAAVSQFERSLATQYPEYF